MSKFLNQASTCVSDALQGLTLCNENLYILEPYQILLRKNNLPATCLLSGGGSGHEPAHAGYVARGMLAAAICGAVFTSPDVQSILAAIYAMPNACLLIVKNYTGDVLNFKLAMELAIAQGKHVDMIIVADDCALGAVEKRRGVAGTIFVHKIAGAAAENGLALQQVKSIAQYVASHTRSSNVCCLVLICSGCCQEWMHCTRKYNKCGAIGTK